MVAPYIFFPFGCHCCQYVHYLSRVFGECDLWAGSSHFYDTPLVQVGLV